MRGFIFKGEGAQYKSERGRKWPLEFSRNCETLAGIFGGSYIKSDTLRSLKDLAFEAGNH